MKLPPSWHVTGLCFHSLQRPCGLGPKRGILSYPTFLQPSALLHVPQFLALVYFSKSFLLSFAFPPLSVNPLSPSALHIVSIDRSPISPFHIPMYSPYAPPDYSFYVLLCTYLLQDFHLTFPYWNFHLATVYNPCKFPVVPQFQYCCYNSNTIKIIVPNSPHCSSHSPTPL